MLYGDFGGHWATFGHHLVVPSGPLSRESSTSALGGRRRRLGHIFPESTVVWHPVPYLWPYNGGGCFSQREGSLKCRHLDRNACFDGGSRGELLNRKIPVLPQFPADRVLLGQSNYGIWQVVMEFVLETHDILYMVETDNPRPDATSASIYWSDARLRKE